MPALIFNPNPNFNPNLLPARGLRLRSRLGLGVGNRNVKAGMRPDALELPIVVDFACAGRA
jgi:hypothetical protein